MDIQVISRDGKPEYAVVPWERYQALLGAAGEAQPSLPVQEATPTPVTAALTAFGRLRELREGKGLALEVLARTVGISPSYLSMIETGERQPDAAIRRSLAWELGVPGWEDKA